MAICQSCKNKWTWKQTLKKSFVLNTAMTCPYCGKKQYYASSTRKYSAIFPLVAISWVFLNKFLFESILSPFSLIILILLPLPVFFALYPMIVKLSNKEHTFGKN